eukprot:468963-Prymnesium_polylepis.2
MNDCAHAAGHGYFYYFFDIGRSVLACTDPTLASHAPGPEFSWDADAKSAGLDGINYMSESPALYVALSTARADSTNLSEQVWRWLCVRYSRIPIAHTHLHRHRPLQACPSIATALACVSASAHTQRHRLRRGSYRRPGSITLRPTRSRSRFCMRLAREPVPSRSSFASISTCGARTTATSIAARLGWG